MTNLQRFIDAIENFNEKDFITNHYNEFSKEELKDIIISLLNIGSWKSVEETIDYLKENKKMKKLYCLSINQVCSRNGDYEPISDEPIRYVLGYKEALREKHRWEEQVSIAYGKRQKAFKVDLWQATSDDIAAELLYRNYYIDDLCDFEDVIIDNASGYISDLLNKRQKAILNTKLNIIILSNKGAK